MGTIVTGRWVPVSEALPGPRERVLVTDGLMVYEGGLGLDGRWYRSGPGSPMTLDNFLDTPTYWMKLPEAPR